MEGEIQCNHLYNLKILIYYTARWLFFVFLDVFPLQKCFIILSFVIKN